MNKNTQTAQWFPTLETDKRRLALLVKDGELRHKKRIATLRARIAKAEAFAQIEMQRDAAMAKCATLYAQLRNPAR